MGSHVHFLIFGVKKFFIFTKRTRMFVLYVGEKEGVLHSI